MKIWIDITYMLELDSEMNGLKIECEREVEYGYRCLEQCNLCWMNTMCVVHVSVVVNAIVTLLLEYYSVWCNHDEKECFMELIESHISTFLLISDPMYVIVCVVYTRNNSLIYFITFIVYSLYIDVLDDFCVRKKQNKMKSKTEETMIWYAWAHTH